MALRRSRRLTRAMKATAPLSPEERRALADWLRDRIAATEAEDEIPVAASRAVVEQRRTPTGTYRLELVKCGKEQCKVCRGGPAHGPYWYMYWKQKGRTRSKYIGKELNPGE
jgi:hypothetical protein